MELTKNFSKKEFDSKDGANMPDNVLINIVKVACNLQRLRDKIGKPVIINSGYRSPEHNKKVGGSPNSQHVLGKAADIKVVGMTPKEVKAVVERLISEGKMHNGGIGLYPTFLHYDCRDNPARWDFRTKK